MPVFRDLKLDNILLYLPNVPLGQEINWKTVNIDDLEVKLGDFGLGRHMPPQPVGGPIPTKTQGLGTEGFRAPEVENSTKYDQSADIYSFGVIMFRLATGEEMEKHMGERFTRK